MPMMGSSIPTNPPNCEDISSLRRSPCVHRYNPQQLSRPGLSDHGENGAAFWRMWRRARQRDTTNQRTMRKLRGGAPLFKGPKGKGLEGGSGGHRP
jgi:hypothetical protein